MSSRGAAANNVSDFVQLLREFLTAHTQLTAVLGGQGSDPISFTAIRDLVRDDDRSVLYRLKGKSHGLFRSDELASPTVRRGALFDLAVGSLFHEAMKLRESLYQREVYAPRVESLRAAAGDEDILLFEEFDRILDRTTTRLEVVVSEVRDLLVRTRDQFRLLLVERVSEREVTRCLLNRRSQVNEAFPEGFEGLLTTIHGDFATGLIEAAHALVDAAYFEEATKTLNEAARSLSGPSTRIDLLTRYSQGMQAFLDGDYRGSIAALEAWVDLGGPASEPAFAARAGAALGRIDRLVDDDSTGAELVDLAKQLQLQLETRAD